jgi:hypothetical protein
MVFHFETTRGGKDVVLRYDDLKSLYGDTPNLLQILDKDKDNVIASKELADFFVNIREKLKGNAFIGGSIIVTKAYHDYSQKRQKEKVCGTCHSKDAPFYDSMFLVLPERENQIYVPVKGTILSAAPISILVDICLLGEQRIRLADLRGLFTIDPKNRLQYAKELGFKWIDVIGIGLAIILLFFILIHIAWRLVVKR